MNFSRSILVLLLTFASFSAQAQDSAVKAPKSGPRIGDPGSVFDPSKYDDRFPLAKEWAKAGVEGGIPARGGTPIVARLKPGDDLPAAIQKAGKGVVLLKAGVYKIDKTLTPGSGLILRGENPETTILEFGGEGAPDLLTAVSLKKVDRVGLEDLTLRNKRVAALDPKTYLEKYDNYPGFPHNDAATVELDKATNSWIQNCRILFSVSRPLRIFGGSAHVTVRDCQIDVALHKGGGGSGYCEVVGGTYVLFYNDTITNIRHICLDAVCDYTVMVYCTTNVDFNWHCIAPMAKTLLEHCTSNVPGTHFWGIYSHYKDAIAPDNHIFHCSPRCDDGSVWHPVWEGVKSEGKGEFIQKMDIAPPKTGTLYPVTGVHRPPDEPAGSSSKK